MFPDRKVVGFSHTDRGFPTATLLREDLEQASDLRGSHTSREGDSPELVLVESLGEVRKHWMFLVRCHPLDDQLSRRHADRNRRSIDEEFAQAAHDVVEHRIVRGMSRRVHCIAMHPDGQFDQKFRQLPRQGGLLSGLFGSVLGHRAPVAVWDGAPGNIHFSPTFRDGLPFRIDRQHTALRARRPHPHRCSSHSIWVRVNRGACVHPNAGTSLAGRRRRQNDGHLRRDRAGRGDCPAPRPLGDRRARSGSHPRATTHDRTIHPDRTGRLVPQV